MYSWCVFMMCIHDVYSLCVFVICVIYIYLGYLIIFTSIFDLLMFPHVCYYLLCMFHVKNLMIVS